MVFEIEQVFAVTGRGVFVMVRLLEAKSSFTLSERPILGKVAIERWFDIPRKLNSDGTPRTDYFVFKLLRAEDRATLQAGDRVALE